MREEHPKQAWCDVIAERHRQISAEGWTTEHDDEHSNGEMARAAAAYAVASYYQDGSELFNICHNYPVRVWPAFWNFKPSDPRRNLVKAAALLLAEIERLDRAAAKEAK